MLRFLRSMLGRVLLVLVLGILASASLTLWLALGERERAVNQFHDVHAVERAEHLALTLNALPENRRAAFMSGLARWGVLAQPLPDLGPEPRRHTRFSRQLEANLGPDFHVVSLPLEDGECGVPRRPALLPPRTLPLCEALGIGLQDGTAVRLALRPPRIAPPPPQGAFLSYLALFLGSVAALSFFVARMTMRPLQRLAQAATDLGHDLNHQPLADSGPTEIRQASAAFNAMQQRIRQHIQQRAHMLAAITHDLQTPVTRMRLRLEKVSDEALRAKLGADLAAMQDMVREGLDLARSMDSGEPMQALDLDSLLDSVCCDAQDAGQDVALEGKCGAPVQARPLALRRCLVNLLDNAVKYGQMARVCVRIEARQVCITIRDGGPGIPPDQLQRVFEPFYRIETSRSRATGGTGLGLTIAANIALQHGGTLTLRNHAEGGLEATLLLPK